MTHNWQSLDVLWPKLDEFFMQKHWLFYIKSWWIKKENVFCISLLQWREKIVVKSSFLFIFFSPFKRLGYRVSVNISLYDTLLVSPHRNFMWPKSKFRAVNGLDYVSWNFFRCPIEICAVEAIDEREGIKPYGYYFIFPFTLFLSPNIQLNCVFGFVELFLHAAWIMVEKSVFKCVLNSWPLFELVICRNAV